MNSSEKGISLLEMILVLMFVSIAFLSILYVFASTITASSDLEGEVTAINLANYKMEELINKSYSAITAEAKATVSGFSKYSRQVTISTAEAGLKRINVIVYWKVKAQEQSYTITTLRNNL